ncbi:nesprin-2-like isoform X2 [Dreissena polymorpha]|uniref:nesprin-2-like isoform X2 n=1 Tax=Dreissena polymorpha TaxID=45954 RepID=UPI002264054A|nr:nesprin-2-like isoform X2 [Dreissena polymorpha]
MSVQVKMSVDDITERPTDYLKNEEPVLSATGETVENSTAGEQLGFPNPKEILDLPNPKGMLGLPNPNYSPNKIYIEHLEHKIGGKSGGSNPFHSVQQLLGDCKNAIQDLLGQHNLENELMSKISRELVNFTGKAIITIIEQRIDWASTKVDIVKIEQSIDERYKDRFELTRIQVDKLIRNIEEKRNTIRDLQIMNGQLNDTIQMKITELLQRNSEVDSLKKTINELRQMNSQLKIDLLRSIDEREKVIFDADSINFECRKEMLGSLLIECEATEHVRKQLHIDVVQNIRREYLNINKIELAAVRRQCETRIEEVRMEYKQASQELSDVKIQLSATTQRLSEMEQKYLYAKQQLKESEHREKITKYEQRQLMNSAMDVQLHLKTVTKHNRRLFDSIRSVDGLIDTPRSEFTRHHGPNKERKAGCCHRLFLRVLRCAFPLQLLLLLLLATACLVSIRKEDYSCTLENTFRRSLHQMLHYTDGPPPL